MLREIESKGAEAFAQCKHDGLYNSRLNVSRYLLISLAQNIFNIP